MGRAFDPHLNFPQNYYKYDFGLKYGSVKILLVYIQNKGWHAQFLLELPQTLWKQAS